MVVTDVSGHSVPLQGSAYLTLADRTDNGWPLKVGQTGCPETSVSNYQSTLSNIPEERRSHLHRDGSLKSRILK